MDGVLDRKDLTILELLQEDARLTDDELGREVALERSAVSKRLKRLKDEKYILGYQAVLDLKKLGLNYVVSTMVMLDTHKPHLFDAFEKTIAEELPNVQQWSRLQGSWDYMLIFVTRDADHYEELHRQLTAMDNVKRTRGHHLLWATPARPLPLS